MRIRSTVLKENPGDEILRCERHQRKVKSVLARVDPLKKGYRFPLRMTAWTTLLREILR